MKRTTNSPSALENMFVQCEAPIITDLYHYALCMQNNGESDFHSHKLLARAEMFDKAVSRSKDISDPATAKKIERVLSVEPNNEKELELFGRRLEQIIKDYAADLNVNPCSGAWRAAGITEHLD